MVFQAENAGGFPSAYAYKTADQSVVGSSAMTADSHLFVSVRSGRKYVFTAVLFGVFTDTVKADLSASTATATNVIASLIVLSPSDLGSALSSSLTTDMVQGSGSADNKTIIIRGAIEPATDGTLAISWGTASSGDSSVKKGSSLSVWRLA